MKNNSWNKLLITSVAALFSCCFAWADGDVVVYPASYNAVAVDGSVTFTITSNNSDWYLRVGTSGTDTQSDWNNDYVKASLSNVELKEGQSVTLTVTGKAVTSAAQTINVYDDSGATTPLCTVTVEKVHEATSENRDITISSFSPAYVIEDASVENEWEPVIAEDDVATVEWDGSHYAIKAMGIDGETKIILKSKTDRKHLVYDVKVASITMTKESSVNKSSTDLERSAPSARVDVVSKYFVGRPKAKAKAFFLGTACKSHVENELKENMLEAMTNALNAVAKKAQVDYSFAYANGTSWNLEGGSIEQGAVIGSSAIKSLNDRLADGNHAGLGIFYDKLYSVATGSVKYDYIILEFDGNLLGQSNGSHYNYTANATKNAVVARFLQKYYDLGRVFWIVNDFEEYADTETKPDQLRDAKYFRPVKWAKQETVDDFWKGLLGILNPDKYLNYETATFETVSFGGKDYAAGDQITGGVGNEDEVHWLTYTDSKNIASKLNIMIKDRSISAVVTDRLNPALTIDKIEFSVSTNKGGNYTSKSLDGMSLFCGKDANNCVTGVISGVNYETWTKLSIYISDKDGKFLDPTKFQCVETDADGISYYDPNVKVDNPTVLGPALTVAYGADGKRYAETNGMTSVAWTYKKMSFKVKKHDDAIKTYDGVPTNIVVEVENPPANTEIYYRNVGEETWHPYDPKNPYKEVKDSTNVEFRVEGPSNYEVYYGTNKVVIAPAKIEVPKYPVAPDPEEEGPGPGTGPAPAPGAEPKGPWAAAYNVKKPYDGLGTNVLYMAKNLDVAPVFEFAYSEKTPIEWKKDENVFTNVTYAADGKTVEWKKVLVRVTAGDNYAPTNIYAYVKITPRDMTKDGDVENNGVFANNQEVDYGKPAPALDGQWTVGSGLVKGDGVESVDLVITNGVDVSKLKNGDYPGLISTNNANAKPIVITNNTGDVTRNYKIRFTPGTLTVGGYPGMKIGPEGPVQHPPAGEPPIPPAEPGDDPSKTGARNVTKVYDGISTNIEVKVVNPAAGATIEYGYDTNTWYSSDSFPGYTVVTNDAPVWFKITADGYQPITNRAFVTITKKNLGGGGSDPDENSIVADDKSIAYGDACPTLTWHGGKGLADGDAVKSVALHLLGGANASELKKNVYTDYVTTNATLAQAIVITNAAGADVTFCYDGFFTPGDFTVRAGGMTIGPGKGPGDDPVTHPPAPENPIPPADPNDEDTWNNGARSVTKPYDGKPTNIIVRVDNPATAEVRYSYDGEFFYEVGEFPGYTTVTNKAPVWYEAKDPEGNFRTITNCAFVTITKKDLGGGGGDPDENSIVADDKSIAYGDACPELTWHGGKGLADGDAVKSVALYLQGGADASTLKKNVYPDYVTTNATIVQAIVITNAAGADVTFCYDGFFTPGDFTVRAGGMTIGPGKGPGDDPVTHPPAPENPIPPADPNDEDTWNNGARSVTKTYDGKPTNIIVRVDNPATAEVRYSYDGEFFYEVGEFPGYTTVTNKAPVWYEAKDPEGNFRTITNRAFVTILKKKLDDDDKNPDNAIVADDKSIAYGDKCPTLTWHGGKGLVAGDSVRSVPLALKGGAVASELAKGVYTGLISTNAAIVIVNSKGVDVTDCYEGFFKPGTLTVDSAAIRYEIEVPNVPYDGKGTNVTVTLITEEDPPFKLKYRGPDTPEGVWLDEPPVYTNAGPYDVTYVIEDGDNYTPVTNTVTMIISPRKITLKSPSKEKTYDGEPLELFADEIAAGGMGFADGERFDFTNLASTKEVGTIKATFAYGDGSAELANYDIVGFEYGTLRVNPNDEQIVVRSASGTWTYDGEAHSTNDFAIIGAENLYEGDWVKAELKLNSVTTPDDGDVTNEFKTAKIYRGPKDDVAGSTEVTKQYGEKFRIDEGLLNVVNAKFSDPVVTSYRDLYDGKDHGIGVDKPQVDGVEIDYPDGNVFRDVTNATVRFVISAPYYDDYVGESTVEILPREVVFTTYDDIKEYDETPLETPKNIDVGGDGFIDGEGYEVSGRDSQTEVGRTDAGFEYQLLSNTKSANYRIRMVKGSLTVYDKDKLTVIATNAVHVYDGREYSNHDFTIKNPPAGCTVTPTFADSSAITYPGEVANRIVSVKIMKGADDVTADYEAVLIDGKLRVTAAKIEGVEVASTNLVYDGEGHSIVVTVPPEYENPVIEYSTTGREGPYQPKNPVFTIADPKGNPNEVYVRITVPGYEEYVTNGYVTITRRPVTVASEDASKKYDGEALSNDCVNVVGEIGLAAGERLFAVTTASQTGVGSTENAFDYVIADASGAEERTKNYDVTIVNGKLEVSPADITPWDPFGPDMGDEPTGPWVWVDAATMVYDGKSGTNVVIRYGNFAEGLPLFQYRPEGTMEFLDFDQAFTNVMYDADGNVRSTNVIVRFTGDANYRSQTLTNKVTILPGGMTIGPGPGPGDKPVVNPPGGQPPIPPADPEDENSWTNGARSVTKHWDGNPTNIIVRVDDPKDGAKIEYSYDGKTWMPEDEFPGYTDVIENGPVWFKITAPNYQPITNCAFVTILRPEAAKFAASLKWQYSGAATFFASLDVINVNENAFQYDEGTMRFCFADREDAGFWLWEFVKGGVNDRLATTIDLEMEGGSIETLRAFKLEDPEFGWLVGMDQHYGPEAGENLTFAQAFEKYNGATPQLYSRSRTATESALDGFVGYLVWEAYGETNSIPLYAGDELPLPRETVKPAKKAVSVARMNESAAYGLNVDSEGATTCEIIDFAVSGDRVNGKIRTGNGVSTGVPSASAKVTIEGTDELGGAADWSGEEVKTTDGEFEINRSHRFYRVRIGVGQKIFK